MQSHGRNSFICNSCEAYNKYNLHTELIINEDIFKEAIKFPIFSRIPMEMSIMSWVLSKLTSKELSFSEKVWRRPAAPRAVRPITHRLSCQFGNPEMITIQNRFSHTTDITTMLTEAADSHHHGLGLNIIQLWLKPGRGTRAS